MDMEYKLYCNHAALKLEEEVLSLDMEDIIECLSEYIRDDIWEALASVESHPCGFFPHPEEIASAVYNHARKCLRQKYAALPIYGQTVTPDGRIVSSSLVDMDYVIDSLITEREESEQCYCDIGSEILAMLGRFLEKGTWHFGLRKEDGSAVFDVMEWPQPTIVEDSVSWMGSNGKLTPIIWFGKNGDEPIGCWSLTLDARMFELLEYGKNEYAVNGVVERWKEFWFPSFWKLDWNALFDDYGRGGDAECYTIWMFAECGYDEPEEEFDLVRKSCPIELDGRDTNEVLMQKMHSFFLEKYNETLRLCCGHL